jgi:hypothetical protein
MNGINHFWLTMDGGNRIIHPKNFLKNSGTNHFQSPQKKRKRK